MQQSTAIASSNWCLSEKTDSQSPARPINVTASPFRIGRLSGLELCLPHPSVSKVHAELVCHGRGLEVRDLGSTNGTYVNGQRIQDQTVLRPADLLQLASVVFQVGYQCADPCSRTIKESVADWARALCQFDHLMSERAVEPHFQPIKRLDDASTIGYESLARSGVAGLEQPRSMFAAAEQLNQQCALSRLLRTEGVRAARGLPADMTLFLNVHPAEVVTDELIASLQDLRREFPDPKLVLELHEATITDIPALVGLRSLLRKLDMGLAFDDFGAGQARLVELTETSPDFVKFDMQLIRGIHEASAPKQRALAALVHLVRDLGIATVAEGVEREEEAIVCRQLGFDLAQGYYYGRPAPCPQIRAQAGLELAANRI